MQVVEDGSSTPSPDSTALPPEGEQISQEETKDGVSEILGSVGGSVISSTSSFLRSSSTVFLSTPIPLGIWKIVNVDEAMYDKGYDTDGDI
eukprot:4495334-Ditylum_brightwellii.AAC.1